MDEQMNSQQNQPQDNPQPQQNNETPKNDGVNVDKHKPMAIIGYIIPILFFVPLIGDETKNNPFAKFHANQQLVLLIAAIIIDIVGSIIPILGWLIILPLGFIFILVLVIMGIVNAAKGEMKKLPVIGKFEIIK